MRFKGKGSTYFFIGLLALGLALFLQLIIGSSTLSVIHKRFPFNPYLFPFLYGLSFLFFFSLWKFLFYLLSSIGSSPHEIKRIFIPFLPLFSFLFSPLLLYFYWSRQDFLNRLWRLALLAIVVSIILALISFEKLNSLFRQRIKNLVNNFGSLSRCQRLVILFFVAFIVYQLTTLVLVLKGVTFSGDEPNYLLITHSLIYDGDINLANNYAQQDYFAFYSREEHPRLKLGIYGRYGKKGKDYIYPINLPGISTLIIPFYLLSQLFSGKVLTFILKGSLSIWGALFSLQVYLLSRDRWGREGLALSLWLLAAFTPPILFYSSHLYPEIVIAFFSVLIFRRLLFGQNISYLEACSLGFLLATFPWFGLKYNFIFWPLLAIGFLNFWRTSLRLKKIMAFCLFPVISQFLFYFFIYHLYGTFSPIAVYEGTMTAEQFRAFWQMVLAIPLSLRLESLLDYFLDQRDGLLLYSPIYFFALAGFIDLWRRSKKIFLLLLFISFPFLFNYSFLTHRQGYSPQARVLTPLIWVGLIALGEFLATNQKRAFRHLFFLSTAITFVFTLILLFNPPFLYQPTTHEFTSRPGDLFVYLSHAHFFLPYFLPSFIKINNFGYWPNYGWLTLIILFLITYAFSRNSLILNWRLTWRSLLIIFLIICFLRIVFPSPPLYPVKTIYYSPTRSLGFYLFYLKRGVVVKEEGDFYLHLEKPYRFIFGSKQELKEIEIRLGSEKGSYEIDLQAFDLPLFKTKIDREIQKVILTLPPAYRRGHLYLYEINLKMKHLTKESMQLEPFMIQFLPKLR
ncbi:MAG: hypothetical protein N3B16_11105 [Candidatus Aminicenantes bacterium]|nr:hypothetical protein [Candidatus Aminicenantes bacterium]